MDGLDRPGTPLRMGPLHLDPVPDAGLQWWFGQGRVTGPTSRLRVMFALFRVRLDDLDGSILLTQSVDETTGAVHAQTRVTPTTLTIEDRIAADVARSRVSPWVPGLRRLALWRHRRDMAGLAARHPAYTVDPKGLRFGASPFVASWGGLLLGHDPARDILRLTLPVGEGRGLEARMQMPDAVMHEVAPSLSPAYDAGFHYQCAPALPLTGRIGAEEVTGTLWIDRQWGDMDGWICAPASRGKALLGWDWFALTLGDDWQILLNRHHLRPEGRTTGAFALIFDEGRPVALPAGFDATPVRFWDSPATGAHYPIEWDVQVPDLTFDARLTPLVEDQELPMPGGLSVWEGAGTLDGTLAGRKVSGRARMELAGYAAVLSIRERLRRRFVAGV